MTIQIRNKYLVLAIFLLILASFVVGGVIARKRVNNALNPVISALNGKIKVYEYKLDSVSKTAYEKEQLILEQKQAIENGLIKNAELKVLNLRKVSEVTSLKAQVRLLIDSIAHTGKVVIVKPCDSTDLIGQPAIYLPFSFSDSTRYYKFEGEFDEFAVMRAGLSLPVGLDVFTGWDKQRKAYKAVVASDNPYVIITGINSLKIETKKPSRFGLGLHGGYGVLLGNPLRSGFYVGAGLSYDLLQF